MKVELTKTITNKKMNLFNKIRRFFVGKLKVLKKDTFEKNSTIQTKKEKIVSRKYPNWCEGADSTYRNNTIARTRHYYPEDVKKMESMTREEKVDYKYHLNKTGRYYYDDNYHVDTPELDAFFKRHNIDLNKYIIKDNK